jgi:hypothetical protein
VCCRISKILQLNYEPAEQRSDNAGSKSSAEIILPTAPNRGKLHGAHRNSLSPACMVLSGKSRNVETEVSEDVPAATTNGPLKN